MVRLNDKRNTVAFKPLHGVMVVKYIKQPFHQSVSTWINLFQVFHSLKCVGTVTASATTYGHLPQYAFAALEDGHLCLWSLRLHRERQEEACGTTAYDCYLHCPPSLSK